MARPGDGTGRLIRDLGAWNGELLALSGEVGGPGQPSTLLVRFYLESPADLQLEIDRSSPRLTRFVSFTLQDARNRLQRMEPGVRTRVGAGSYDIAIATLDWRLSPWAFTLHARLLGSLKVRFSAAPGVRTEVGIKRLSVRFKVQPGITGTPQRITRLSVRPSTRPGSRGGLISQPSYEPPSTDLLSHAWVAQAASSAKVGSADGSSWVEITDLPVEPPGYIGTPLLPDDYTDGSNRLIFSRESPAYYGLNPGIGPVPADVTTPASPDYPGVPFLALTSGAYRRDILFALPAGNDRQVVVQLREVLRWGNDIVRDLQPSAVRYTASNRLARAKADRRYTCWLVTRFAVRPLQGVPLQLVTRVDSLLPPLARSLIRAALRVPGEDAIQARVSCLFPSFVATQSLPSPGDALFLSPPEAPFSGLPLSYGLTRNLRADRDFFSPAIYDTLAAGGSLYALPGYDPQDYGFVAGQLSSLPAGLRQYSPWFQSAAWAESGTSDEIYQSNTGSPLSYGRWDGAPPADAGLSVDPLSTSWTRIDSGLTLASGRLNRTDEPRALVSLDWGRPIECRIRLLELGFPAADLEVGDSGDPRFLALAARPRLQPGLGGVLFSQRTVVLTAGASVTPGLDRSRLASSAEDVFELLSLSEDLLSLRLD